MPTVPRYDSQQVQERALPGVRVPVDAPAEAFGGGQSSQALGQATRDVLNPAMKMAEEQYALANKLRVTEERDALNRKENELLYDPKKGALLRQGKNAFGVPDEVSGEWSKFVEEREKGLGNAEQRAAFKELVGARWDSMNQKLLQHVAGQTKVYEEGVFNSSLESSKERGSVDPRNAQIESAFIRQEVTRRAQSLGLSPEQTQQEIQKHESDLYTRGIDRLLTAQQDAAASGYYQAVKDRIDPDTQVKIEKALQEGALLGKAQKGADEIMGETRNLTEALALAKERYGEDPKARKEIESQLEHRFSVQQAAKRQREEDLYLNASNIVDKARTTNAIPRNQWALLPLSAKSALTNYAQSLASGEKISTDLRVFEDLKLMAANPKTRNKFVETPLVTYIDKLSPTDYKTIVEVKAGIVRGDDKTLAELDGIQSDTQIVHGAMRRAGIDPTPKDTDKKASDKAYEVQRKIDLAVKSEASRLGRKLRNEEIATIAEDQLVKGVTEEHWYGNTTKKRYELEAGEKFKVTDIDEVPKSERDTIRALYIKNRGVAPTDAEILKVFNGEKLLPKPAPAAKPAAKAAAPRAPSAAAPAGKPSELAETAGAVGSFVSDFASTLKNSIKVPGGI